MRMPSSSQTRLVELECLEGLAPFVAGEVSRRLPRTATLGGPAEPRAVRIVYSGELRHLFTLRTPVAAWLLLPFAGRRPTTVVGDGRFASALREVLGLERFTHFGIGGPGPRSTAMRRIAEAVADVSGLPESPRGELVVRLRRSVVIADGWDALVRLTPRPLATRSWRVVDLPGALHANVAAAMIELTRPQPSDAFLNIACGTGTLLAERLSRAPAALVHGCDIDPAMLEAASANLREAGCDASLSRMDARELALRTSSVDAICVALPYGDAVGSHDANVSLYPALLREGARVIRAGRRLVAVSQEVRLLSEAASRHASLWKTEERVRVYHGGKRPLILALRRQR